MNKLLATAAIFATTVAVASNATAAERNNFPYWYLGLSGGGAVQKDSDVGGSSTDLKWDTGYVISASLGYQPPSFGGFRVEGEISEHKQDISNGNGKGDVKADVAAANLYYDFYNSGIITPYIGGGLGYARFDASSNSVLGGSDNSNEFIYQGMAGIGIEPKSVPNVGFTLGYRYMAPFSDPSSNSSEYEYDNHSVELGAKFRF